MPSRSSAGSPRTLALEVDCDRWGAYALGPLRVRRYDQLRLVADEHTVDLDAMLRVYPTREALRALVPADRHASRGRRPGRADEGGRDRARRAAAVLRGRRPAPRQLAASARTGELVVNELHPERNTAVVLLLDTFAELGTARNPLDECVRAAAALAERYLARRDRVGLLPLGGQMRWLRPASGAVQRQRIVETLLEARPLPPSGEGARLVVPTRFVPPQALVLALTPLLDDAVVAGAARAARPRLRPRRRRAAAALLRLARRRGRAAARLARARPPAQPAAGARDRGRRMGRGAVARGDRSRDGGVPTKSSRRPRVATAVAALVAALACAAYPVVSGSLVNGLVPFACLIGIGAMLAGLLALWEDGLALGPAAIALGYALSLAPGDAALDRGAPARRRWPARRVELGSWSLELRDGPEERLLSHLARVSSCLSPRSRSASSCSQSAACERTRHRAFRARRRSRARPLRAARRTCATRQELSDRQLALCRVGAVSARTVTRRLGARRRLLG